MKDDPFSRYLSVIKYREIHLIFLLFLALSTSFLFQAGVPYAEVVKFVIEQILTFFIAVYAVAIPIKNSLTNKNSK